MTEAGCPIIPWAGAASRCGGAGDDRLWDCAGSSAGGCL